VDANGARGLIRASCWSKKPTFCSNRLRHRTIDLHGIDTRVRSEFAYPMAVGGHLVGVLAIGPKNSGDPYAPDESQAIAELATAVGAALAVHALAGKEGRLRTGLGERLRSLGLQS
jgi:GAF domain-containing protein